MALNFRSGIEKKSRWRSSIFVFLKKIYHTFIFIWYFFISKKHFSVSIVILFFTQLALSLFIIGPGQVKAFGNGFFYSRSITIDHTKVPNTDQSNFPVLVSGTYTYLKTTANGGLVRNSSGYDIGFFTSSDCSTTNKMSWETETYTSTTGAVSYWVKVSSLSHTSDTVFYLCYGNSSISTDQSSSTLVWDSGYKAVYHLPNGTALTTNDSTSNAKNATNHNSLPVAGKIDGGARFDGAAATSAGSATYIDLPASNSFGLTNQATYALWISTTNTHEQRAMALYRVSNSSQATFMIGGDASAGDANDGKPAFSYRDGSNAFSIIKSATSIADGNFHLLEGTVTGTSAFLYVDGVVVASSTNVNNANTFTFFTDPAALGAFTSAGVTDPFTGSLDEFRISNFARSSDWIATEYNNQNSPSTFYTVGAELTDTTSPIFSAFTPASSSFIRNVTSSSAITFTTDEALASGTTTITRTSGTTDSNSPHVCVLKGTALNVGSHTINLSDTTNSCTADVSNLVSGAVYTFVLAGQDAFGNLANPVTSTAVTFDNTPPTVSEVTPVTTPTNDSTPNYIFNTNEAGTITYGGDCSSVTTSTSAGTSTITFASLSDGTHSNCTISVTDTTGNTSTPLSVTAFTIDTAAPSAPGTPNMTTSTDNGSSSTDDITSNTTPSFVISCESGATVSLAESSTVLGTGTCASSIVTVTSSALSQGSHSIKAFQVDAAANTSTDSGSLSITISISPTVTTQSVSAIAATAATGNGNITATGGANVTVRGFVYGTSISYGSTTTESGSFSTGAFTGSITSLTCNTLYHVNAYATNPVSTSYGSDVTFTTSACVPTVTTSPASSVTASTLTLNGSITATGGADATQSGFAYGTSPTLATTIATSTLGAQSGTASFSEGITGLSPSTTYYFRAYAINSTGIGYGSIQSTTTLPTSTPVLTTSAASGVTDSAATLNGSIDGTGGENASVRGFEWGHTIAYDATTTESGSHSAGSFSASLSALICDTQYHFRSYARNSAGIGYGSDQTFTTAACPVSTPSSVGGGSGGFTPPSPRAPEGGYIFYITPNPTTNGLVTFHFGGGQDATKIEISDNSLFVPAAYIDYVDSVNWVLQGGVGEKTFYVKFCNQYSRCGETLTSKVVYSSSLPQLPPQNTKTGFIGNLIRSIIKIPEPKPELEQPVIPVVKEEPPQALEGSWNLLSSSTAYNFSLAPLPSNILKLTTEFPELGKVFANLGITKISDLDKLKNTSINLPVFTEKEKIPPEVLVAEGSQGLIPLSSSIALTSKGEIEQKIETIAGKPIVLSVKPESPAESIKGYLLFKRKPEKTALEVPVNSLVAKALFVKAAIAQTLPATTTVEQELLVLSFEYTDPDHDGIFTAEIPAPEVEGEYEVLTVINYKDKEKGSKELRMITVVDPEGYVYEKNPQGKEVRLDNVKVSLVNIINDSPSLWDAAKYHQTNPQITDNTGKYSFLVPPGKYYITAEAKGYKSYKSDQFDVKEGAGVHFNIEMIEIRQWYKTFIDWKMLIIIIFGIALLVDFIKGRRSRKTLPVK
ncbi:MAG TPA: LamG-like jellyroll fold domain-containing protein [Candidatus Udaeobacter sp.]|nr:LamG-like jellyroll fold domain-containing protein [Candidatus Udaeobacter sp.]